MEWMDYFQEHILDRGLYYYYEGNVVSLNVKNNQITAEVAGTDLYLIQINIKDGDIIEMSCECPYAQSGQACKHLAATLYAFEENQDNDTNQNIITAKELVNQADENFVRSFLVNLLENDTNIYQLFYLASGYNTSKDEIEKYKQQVNDIFEEYLYPDNFIHYHEARRFSFEITDFIEREIENILIKNQQHHAAFEITTFIFNKLQDLPIDDSSGELTYLASVCVHSWDLILDNCDSNQKETMFDYFINWIDTSRNNFAQDYIINFLFSRFSEEEFLDQKIDFSLDTYVFYKTRDERYETERWALNYLRTLNSYGEMDDEIVLFCEENLKYSGVREFYVDYLIAEENYDNAIKIIENNRSSTTFNYLEKLKNMYLKTNKKDAYQNLLFDLVTKAGAGRPDLFNEYKSLFSEDIWLEKRSQLLSEMGPWSGVDKILYEEEMYDELLTFAVEEVGLTILQKYEKKLYELDPKKVLDKYEKEIRNDLKYSGNRNNYRRIAYTILDMKELSNNHPRVEDLIKDLRTVYNNRPAMLDEFRKIL